MRVTNPFFPSPLRMQPGTEPPGPEGGNAGRRPRLAAMTYRKTTMGATVIRTSGSEGAILWKCEHVRLDFFAGFPRRALRTPKGEWWFPTGRAVCAEGGMAVHRGDAKWSCPD